MRMLEGSQSAVALRSSSRDAFDRTIGQEIERRAALQPERPAMESSGFSPLPYRELQRLISETRLTLRRSGYGRNERIAVALPSTQQAAVAIVSIACSAVSIPLSPRLTQSEIELSLKSLNPAAILLLAGTESEARRAAVKKGVSIIEVAPPEDGVFNFSIVDLPQRDVALVPDESDEPDPDAPAFILQTSGTTAEPKKIPFSHRNMIATAFRCETWFGLTPQDRSLSAIPIFYGHGLKVTVVTPLLTGGTVVFPADMSKFDYAEWFGALKPTWCSAGPTLHRLVFDRAQSIANAEKSHSLRFLLSSGAPLPLNVLEGLQGVLGVPVVEHYSSGEASLMATNLLPPARSKPGSMGVPWPDSLIIVDDHELEAPRGTQGEVLVRGATVFSGYLGAPNINSRSFWNGWFKTGDIGSLDQDGFLTLHGRKNDVINRGGEKISPAEIDELLARHPAVFEAAAFSVPHPRLGEDIAAAVVLRPGVDATSAELRRYLQGQVAPFKVPRRIIFRDALPKGSTGKILRRSLAEDVVGAVTERASEQPPLDNSPIDLGLVAQLTELWERLLKVAPISLDDDFLAAGGDSLLAIEMLAELEKLTGKTIPSSVLLEASTIRQLARILSENAGLKPQKAILLNSHGSREPLIYFHNDYIGGGYYTLELANLLGPDQPLLVVSPHGVDGEPIPDSIEAMALDRLKLITDMQSKGPYRLCGYCASGLVAFEVARKLIASGEMVEAVGMIDPPTVNANGSVYRFVSLMNRARPFAGRLVKPILQWTFRILTLLDKLRNLPAARRWEFLKAKTRKLFGDETSQVLSAPIGTSLAQQSADERNPKYAQIVMNYLPEPLAVPVTYFSLEYSGDPWRRISPDLDVVRLPGTHADIDLTALADQLRGRLTTQR